MRAGGALLAFLLFACFIPRAWSSPLSLGGSREEPHPSWNRGTPAERLATVSVGLFASYAPFDFPRTNERLSEIAGNLEKLGYARADLRDLGSGLGVLGYVQVLIWEGVGLRLSLLHVKAKPPEAFGSLRADVDGNSSPVNLSYSVVREFHVRPVTVVIGAGVDQYRWDMSWRFGEIGEDPLEEWEWEGRGTGGHGFLEVVVPVSGLYLLAGAAYHRGVMDMDVKTLPPTTQLALYPRHYEEDVSTFHLYGGLTMTIF